MQLDKKGLSLDEVLESDEFVEFNEKGVKVDLSNSYDLMSDNIKSFKLLKGKQEKSSDLNENAEQSAQKRDSKPPEVKNNIAETNKADGATLKMEEANDIDTGYSYMIDLSKQLGPKKSVVTNPTN